MIWGQDGTGKTTFLQKISSDWSKTVKGSKESNPSIALLNHKLWNVGLLIPIVLSEVRGGTSLEEVIKKQLGLQQNSQIKTVRDYLQHHPEHSLLVMDGLDECNLDEKSDIFKILSGEMLSEVLCIVTSNPYFKQKISFDCELQLLGFTEKKAKDYIFQFFRPGERRDGLPQRVRSSKGENMWDKIKFNEDLLQMAFWDLQKMILGEGQCKIGNDMEILLSPLADNTKLEILVFSRNLLGFEGYKSLANAAKDLRNMKELRIAGGGGTNSKEFETLFSSISSEQMEVLDVSSNKLGDAGVQALGHFVERQHSLKELRADSCQTASTDSWEPLLQGLQQTDKLQILFVENNLIGEKMKILMVSMFSLDQLKHLNIGNCGCEQPVILSNILSKLVSNDEVEFVNFGGNTLDITCVQQVEAAPNLGRLQTMCVAKSFQNDPESINCITESMKKTPSLTELDLSNHQINGTLLADSLEYWPKLKGLSLAECLLSEEEIVANVLRKLPFNKLIEILNLSWNNLGNKGFMELDSTLEYMNNLTELNVCQCEGSNIDIMGAFLQSLKTKNKLRKLDLSHNYVGSKGVEILSDHAPKSIEHLRMRFCQVKGAKEVIKLLINLAGNGNLKVLDLCNNKIGNGIMNLVGLRKCLEKMQVLDLSENELDVEQSLKLEKDITSRYPQMEFLV